MSQVKRYTVGALTGVEDLYNCFSNLNCPLISVGELKWKSNLFGFHLFVDTDKTEFYFHYSSGDKPSNRQYMETTIRGTVVYTDEFNYAQSGSTSITVVCSDNLFYFQVNKKVYVFEKIDNNVYIGYNFSGSNFKDLSSVSLYDDNDSIFTHSARLNYLAQLGFIEYSSPNKLFQSNIITDIEDNNFVDCSTVTADQVITFNGKNYYSIGTNILVQMDD